jgi:ribonuclease R
MKFTVSDLIDTLSTTDPLPLDKLEKALGLSTKKDRQLLQVGLDGLRRLGLVQEDDQGIRRLPTPDLVPARLRCSSKGFCFALREDGQDDVYIRDHQLNHAWNGDRVLVRVTREGGRRRSPEGSIQCVLDRQTTSLLAQLEQQDDRLVALPLDDRLLTVVELPPTDAQFLHPERESVMEVLMDQYPIAQIPPQGHVIRSLPVDGDEQADIDLLLTKHHLRDRSVSPRASLRTPVVRGREDLTALPTLMVSLWEGEDAPSLPAISLEQQEGGWRLWVHSPAVGERFSVGSALDTWLRQQGEAICLGRRWMGLLSPALARASAFAAGTPQAALSVALDLSEAGELRHYRFMRSQIRPDGCIDRLAMEAMAARKSRARTVPAALRPLKACLPMLEQLVDLTARLRERRLAMGSIDLDLPLPPLERLGDLREPPPDASLRSWCLELNTTHPAALLRESVLIANRALGNHLAALGLPALFATQTPCQPAEVQEVAKAALTMDIPLELSENGEVSLAELAAAFAATDRSRALQQQLRDSLPPVLFSEQPGPHALAGESTAYAPWCCPALHYADLWNQFLLVSLLTDGKDRPTVRHRTGVELASDSCHGAITWSLLTPSQLAVFQEAHRHELAHRLNGRVRILQEFQADVVAMAQARHAQPLVGQTLPGVISGVQSYGFFVEIPPSQVEGLVHVSSLKDDWYEYRSRQNRLVGRKGRRTYMVGDAVEVEIQSVDVLRHQIDLIVLHSEEGSSSAAEEGSADPGQTADTAMSGSEPQVTIPR